MNTFKFSLDAASPVYVWEEILHEQIKPMLMLESVCRSVPHLSGVRFWHGAKRARSNRLAGWCPLPIAWMRQKPCQIISCACPVNIELRWIHSQFCCRWFIDLRFSNVQKCLYPRLASADLQKLIVCRSLRCVSFGTRGVVPANDYKTKLSSTRCVINGRCQSRRNTSASVCCGPSCKSFWHDDGMHCRRPSHRDKVTYCLEVTRGKTCCWLEVVKVWLHKKM